MVPFLTFPKVHPMPHGSSNPSLADYLTVGEAAAFLGVSAWTLRNWDRAGKLKPMRHPKNGYRIYRHQDLTAILQPIDGHCKTDHTLTPSVNMKQMGEEGHFVQFYENDQFLIESVSDFMEPALVGGVGSLVIATRDHREGIERLLQSRGLDIPAAAAAGRYVALDAGQTLAELMVDGAPIRGSLPRLLAGRLRGCRRARKEGGGFCGRLVKWWHCCGRREIARGGPPGGTLERSDAGPFVLAFVPIR